jgi:hypothetical protein
VRRRRFLLSVGAVGGLGALGFGARPPERRVDVHVRLSETAAAYDGVRERARGYLRRALEPAVHDLDVTFGDPVSVSTEDAYDLVTGGEWPLRLAGDPGDLADDVNLLVTDGDMSETPTGAGVPHVAAVGGARHLAQMPPAADAPDVMTHTPRAHVTQVLLHEVGHALGLDHDHGAITPIDDAVIVTPMVSAYAWLPAEVKERHFNHDRSACGHPFVDVGASRRDLALDYSPCAREALASYQGGFLP